MKFYGRVLAAIVLLIILLMLLQKYGEGKNKPQAAASVTTPVPATLAPVAQASPAPPAPAPAVPAGLSQAASQRGYSITGVQSKDGWLYITVVGRDRNHLNDFLDVAQRSGLKAIDENYQQYRQFVANGRSMAQNTYKMRF
jgi:hypothetical protein